MPSSRSIDWGELYQKSAHLGKKQPRYEGGLLGKLQCCHSLYLMLPGGVDVENDERDDGNNDV